MSDDNRIVEVLNSLKKKVDDLQPLIKKVETLEKDNKQLKEDNAKLKKAAVLAEQQLANVGQFLERLPHTLQSTRERLANIESSSSQITEQVNVIKKYLNTRG